MNKAQLVLKRRNICLPNWIFEEATRAAQDQGLSMSAFIRMTVVRYIQQNQKLR